MPSAHQTVKPAEPRFARLINFLPNDLKMYFWANRATASPKFGRQSGGSSKWREACVYEQHSKKAENDHLISEFVKLVDDTMV